MIAAFAAVALAGPTGLGGPEGAKHRALVIGVGAYTDDAFRGSALGAPADADAIAGLLRASTVRFNAADGADKPSEVVGSVTESMLSAAFAGAMKGLGEGDDLFVYFAGHAIAAPRAGAEGETDLWLLASDARAADPLADAISLNSASAAARRSIPTARSPAWTSSCPSPRQQCAVSGRMPSSSASASACV